MFTITIIDDEINATYLNNNCQIHKTFFDEITSTNDTYTHSTKVVNVMNNFFDLKKCQIHNLIILDKNLNASISLLKNALIYCITNNHNFILMSLGTKRPSDALVIKKYIDILVQNNAVILAGLSNDICLTYPASFNGVFGIRYDFNGILDKNSINYIKDDLLNTQLVVNFDFSILNDIYIYGCNSLSVPIVAAHIINLILNKKLTYNYANVWELLQKNINSIEHELMLSDYLAYSSSTITIATILLSNEITNYIALNKLFSYIDDHWDYEILAFNTQANLQNEPRLIQLSANNLYQIINNRNLINLYTSDILFIINDLDSYEALSEFNNVQLIINTVDNNLVFLNPQKNTKRRIKPSIEQMATECFKALLD